MFTSLSEPPVAPPRRTRRPDPRFARPDLGEPNDPAIQAALRDERTRSAADPANPLARPCAECSRPRSCRIDPRRGPVCASCCADFLDAAIARAVARDGALRQIPSQSGRARRARDLPPYFHD